jgi:hypothetical protein
MFIKGIDINHPVLLYLHGGMPDYFLTEKYPTGLEDLFTVVWWEMRGSGISFTTDIPREARQSPVRGEHPVEHHDYHRPCPTDDEFFNPHLLFIAPIRLHLLLPAGKGLPGENSGAGQRVLHV